jgi:hypothetical protein
MGGTASEWDATVLEQQMKESSWIGPVKKSTAERLLPRFDPVDKPEHYNSGKVECIEAIKASMSEEEYKGYLKGNTIKYLWRYQYKGKPVQDLKKAQWYLNKLIEANA